MTLTVAPQRGSFAISDIAGQLVHDRTLYLAEIPSSEGSGSTFLRAFVYPYLFLNYVPGGASVTTFDAFLKGASFDWVCWVDNPGTNPIVPPTEGGDKRVMWWEKLYPTQMVLQDQTPPTLSVMYRPAAGGFQMRGMRKFDPTTAGPYFYQGVYLRDLLGVIRPSVYPSLTIAAQSQATTFWGQPA